MHSKNMTRAFPVMVRFLPIFVAFGASSTTITSQGVIELDLQHAIITLIKKMKKFISGKPHLPLIGFVYVEETRGVVSYPSHALEGARRIVWLVSSIVLSLTSSHQATTGSRARRVSDWCSEMHCQDCVNSEAAICSNGATSDRSGDLCGCCSSCVQIHELGESCGSQLAVRSSPNNFGNLRSRFTVLATVSCRYGLVCINFTCKRSKGDVDRVVAAPVERNGENSEGKSGSSENDGTDELDDLRTNEIDVENSHEFHYPRYDYDDINNSQGGIDDVFTTRETVPERSTSIPWPIALTTEMLPITRREARPAIDSGRPHNEFDSPVDLVNVLIVGREFQLIHGREPLADLNLLLQSIDKSHSTSVVDEFEALLLYERFKDVLGLVNSDQKSSSLEEAINPASTVDSQDQLENKNRRVIDSVRDPGGLAILRKFAASHISKLSRPRVPIRFPMKFRKKRELEDPNMEDPRSGSEEVVPDFLNDISRMREHSFRRWFIASAMETISEEGSPTDRLSDPEIVESTINIYITEVPRKTKSTSEIDLGEVVPTRFPAKFRKKRELDDSEDKDPRTGHKNVVPHFLNDTPRTTEDPSRRWYITGEMEATSEEGSPTVRLSDPEVVESTINIHITDVPRKTKSTSEFELLQEERARDGGKSVATGQEYDDYDDKLEIFVTDANTEFPNFSEVNESFWESTNFTTSPMSEASKNFGRVSNEADNVTENDWETLTLMAKGSGYFDTNYEFTFPESPVIMEDDDSHEFDLRVNETVEEFRAQLNRIEARVVVIESSLYDMMRIFGTKDLSSGTGNEELDFTSKSDNFPFSASNATGRHRDGSRILKSAEGNQLSRRYVLSPRMGGTHIPEENVTYVVLGPSRGNANGKNFRIKDEGIENSLYYMTNIGTNERSLDVGKEVLSYTSKPDDFPYSGLSATGRHQDDRRIYKFEKGNQFLRRYVLSPRIRGTHRPKENLTYVYLGPSRDNSNGKSLTIEDEGIGQLVPIRSNRRWRTVTWQPGQAEVRKVFESRGRPYSSRSQGDKVHEEVYPSRKKLLHQISDWRNQEFIALRPGARKIPKEGPARSTGRIQSPTVLSNIDGRSFSTRSPADHFSREQYSLKASPSRSTQQVLGPLNAVWSRPLSTERSKRKSSEAFSHGGRNSNIGKTPLTQESVVMLETQIPKPLVGAEEFKDFENGMRVSSTRLATIPVTGSMRRSLDEADDWNWSSWGDGPSLNFFVVNSESSSADEPSSGIEESLETIVLPMENENSDILEDRWEVAYPSYLDYSEHLYAGKETEKTESPIAEAEVTGSSVNLQKRRRIKADGSERIKRSVDDFFGVGNASEVIISGPKNISTGTQRMIPEKSSSRQRSRRSVQMADWLRAAEEYHERLQQMRTAALKTWLASKDELADTNLTNVKLFTREIPTYLERYRTSFTAEDDLMPDGDTYQVYPIVIEDSLDRPSLIPNNDDVLFTKFLLNESASLTNDSKTKKDDKNGEDSGSETSSTTARKFTIIATGNSTIRIEELPESGEAIEESLFRDHSAQGSISREQSVDRRTVLTSTESDDFDHMYEGVDAEDEDFDYGDPNIALSRWLDEIDIIDASSVEIPVDKAESTSDDVLKDEKDYEVDELLRRSKRDSPLFLFTLNGDPGRDVIVWPSNWKDFIDRHSRRNRTRSTVPQNSLRRATKRTRPRVAKLGTPRTTTSDTSSENSRDGEAEISASVERTVDDKAERDSSMELTSARRFQHAFDNRPRQNKRKNSHRGNIGNY